MDYFDCAGYLRILVDANSDEMLVTFKHEECHTPYLAIDLPDKWKRYIEANARSHTPGQVRPVC